MYEVEEAPLPKVGEVQPQNIEEAQSMEVGEVRKVGEAGKELVTHIRLIEGPLANNHATSCRWWKRRSYTRSERHPEQNRSYM